MQRANPPNPFYVDTRTRFAASTPTQGQTSDPTRHEQTQNPSGTAQFTAPEFTNQPTTSAEVSSNLVDQTAERAPHIDEVSQGEDWETRVQLGHSTTEKMF